MAAVLVQPIASGQVNPPAPVSVQVSTDPARSDRIRLRVSGAPGATYVVEEGSDLSAWTPVVTNTVSSAGYFDFVELQAGRFPQRFYRAAPSASADSVSAQNLLEDFRQDRVLVKPKSGILSALGDLHASVGVQVLQSYPGIGNLQVVKVPATASITDLISTYRRSGLVEYAEPDYRVQALQAPNDFHYGDGSLWGLHNTGIYGGTPGADISAEAAWDIQNNAGNIIVAVIDTGVRYTHEDLADNMWVNPGEIPGNGIDDDGDGYVDDVHGINVINHTGDPNDDYGHGTHVSGTIGAVGNNTVGIVGVCWKVQIMACKFLDSTGNGFISDAVKCMDYARSKGAKVINASWGSTSFTSQSLRDAIASLRQAGIIFVAAAGNSSQDNGVNPIYPASYDLDNIISVAATTRNDDLAVFSNYGATTVDLGAPGDPIFSCWNTSDSDYRYFQGTSMAAPHVTGACALLMAHYPNDNYQQIINRILSNVDPLPALAGKCVSGGRLNLLKALSGGSPSQGPTVTVVATDPNASEQGPDSGTFTISRTGNTSASLTVKYTLAGTGQNGTDYQPLGTSVTIAAGASSATVTVTPIDDTVVEGNETVVLTILQDAAYTVGSPSSATITIADNDGTPPAEPVLTLSAFDAEASESGPDNGIIRFHRTGDTSQAIQVSWTFSGTAVNGVDYQQLPTTSPFPAGLADADLTITPIDDSEVEGDETVIVTLVAGAGYSVGSPSSATVTLHDNDQGPPPPQPTVSVAATDPDASEQGPDPATFTLSRSGSMASALTVRYSLGGSAANGIDYQTLPTSVTIPAGAASATVTVTPIDDSQVESDETVVLTLSQDAAYDVGSPNSATVTIHDNDSTPPPAPTADFTANTTSGQAPLTVQFTERSSGSITSRDWNFGDGSSHSSTPSPSHTYNNAGDYTATLKVTGSGGSNSKSLAIHVTAAPPPAPTADFTANNTSGQAPLAVQFTDRSSGSITSRDWDFGDGSSHSSTQSPSHTYNNAGDYTATLTVTGSGGSNSKSLAIHATAPPPPAPTADFTANTTSGQAPLAVQFTDRSSGSITSRDWDFGDGSSHSSTQSPSHTYNNAGDYTATLTVTGSGGSKSKGLAIHVTAAQPPPPDGRTWVSVAASDPRVSGSGDIGVFTISRTGSTAAAVTVRYSLGGTPQNGVDYQTLPGSVTIPAGASSADVKVVPTGPSRWPIDKDVYLMLEQGTGYIVGTPNFATLTIAGNNQPSDTRTWVSVAASVPVASASGAIGVFTISRTASTAAAVTVRYSLGGTPQNGVDYQTLSGSVTIPAGASSADVKVVPTGPSRWPIDKDVYLMLEQGTGYIVGTPNYATLTIAGNNQPADTRTWVSVVASDQRASGSGDIGVFTVSRTGGGTASAVTVRYSLGGTPQNGVDYQTLPGSVTIPAGASSADVKVVPTGPSRWPIDKDVYLMLEQGPGYIVGTPNYTTVTIAGNN